MHYRLKPLRAQTLVITGASSGIGLATARAAAAHGANLVLAARNAEALEAIVQEINGGQDKPQAVHVVADVSQLEDVERIAQTAVQHFGGFDTWVNNAGVTIYGRLEQVRDDDSHRLFATNFWGVVNGSLIAVRHLRQRGGALINLGSVASDMALPLQGMYSASKHAVKGFTDALRMELVADHAPVSVTLIKPGAIDTPYPHHARNYLAEEPKHAPPVYPPQEVAEAILYAATHPKRDIYVGSSSKTMSMMTRLAPRMVDGLAGSMLMKHQRRNQPARHPTGALREAGYGGQERGDQPGRVMRQSYYTRSTIHPAITGSLFAAASLAAVAAIASRRRHFGNGRKSDRVFAEAMSLGR